MPDRDKKPLFSLFAEKKMECEPSFNNCLQIRNLISMKKCANMVE
jgi:hypothetical protein